jgi:TolA-binding protein
MTVEENGVVSDTQVDGSANNVSDPEKRLLKDVMKFKNRAKELEQVVDDLKNKIESLQQNNLKEKEDYKALYEAEVTAHKETKRRADGLKQNITFSEKHRAVYPALKKAGLIDEAEKLISEAELDKLELEVTSSGRFNVIGIETFVESFKSEYPFAFKSGKTPNINSGVTNNSIQDNQVVTAAMVIAAEGDKVKHKQLLEQFLKQKRK